MTILVILGGALVTILQQGVSLWHTAEKRGAIYERARTILELVSEDVRAASGDSRAEGTGLWVRFLCDADANGNPRLRLTRAVTESQDPILREGGSFLDGLGGLHADLHGDAIKARDGKLLPSGGYEEVIYAMDPEPGKGVLWRGIRSPPGGAGSLFIDRNVEEDPAKIKERAKKSSAPSAKKADEPHPLTVAARPFADGILHFSFAFWAPFTTTWDRSKPPKPGRQAGAESGPIVTWDSTRAFLDEKGVAAGEYAWRAVEGSLDDPFDDVFPERVEVILVLAGSAEARPGVLAEDLSSGDKAVVLSTVEGLPQEGPDRFVWVEGEWIGYEKIDGTRLLVSTAKELGRGARGTKAAAHPRGTAVDPGTTFRRVIEVPAARVDSFPVEAEKRRRP
jgi:hypothetical protein